MRPSRLVYNSIFVLFVSCLILFQALAVNYFNNAETVGLSISVINFSLSLFNLYKSRDSAVAAPVYLLICYVMYSILLGRYFLQDVYLINNIIDYKFDWVAQVSLFVFQLLLSFFLIGRQGCLELPSFIRSTSNSSKVLAVLLVVFAGWLQVYFIDTSQLHERASYSPLYEHALVFYILAFYFSKGQGRSVQVFVISVAMFFIFRDFYLGHRVTGLQISAAIYFFYLTGYYNFKRLLIVVFCVLLMANFLALYRNSFVLSFSDINSVFSLLFGEKLFTSDTAVFAYVASVTFVATREILENYELFIATKGFMYSLIVPGASEPLVYAISKEFFPHSNGGLLPVYMYFYFGWLGPFLAAALVCIYSSLKPFTRNGLFTVLYVYFFSTALRWMLYSPFPLIKGAIFCFSAFVIARFIYSSFLILLRKYKYV